MIGIEIFYTNPASKQEEFIKCCNVKNLKHDKTVTSYYDVEKKQHIMLISELIKNLYVYEVLDENEIIGRYLALANGETLEDIARED